MTLTPEALRPGDVLLMLGTGWSSHLIADLDGAGYSHSAVFDGEAVLGCVPKGVIRTPLPDYLAAGDVELLDVWRYHAPDDAPLGAPGWPADPVLARADAWLEAHAPYAFHDLYLMGVLAVARRLPRSAAARKALWTAINGAEALIDELGLNADPGMTCSEYVYRCFTEAAAPGPYALPIRDAWTLPPDPGGAADAEAKAEAELRGRARDLFARLKPEAMAQAEETRGDPWGRSLVVPEFVSPRDLRDSPATRKVGRLI